MKKFFIPILILLVSLTGCDALSKLTQFEMPLTQSVTFPANPISNLNFDAPPLEVQTNSATFFSTNNINTDLIDKVSLKSMDMTVTAPADGDFGFLKSIEISIVADSVTTIKIASFENVPIDAGATLHLNVESAELKQYILKDKIKLKMTVSTDKITLSDYTVAVKPVFLIDAKILGL